MDKTPKCERCFKPSSRPYIVWSDLMAMKVCVSCAAYAEVLDMQYPNGVGALRVSYATAHTS